MKLTQPALDKAFGVTSYYEGGYCGIAGNGDGQGLSLGFLQWNFGQGTLQPLLLRVFNEFPQLTELMPENGKWLLDALRNGWCMDWAAQIQEEISNKCEEPGSWYKALYDLCSTPEFQQIQRDGAQEYVDAAIRLCNEFNIYTDRAFSLFFDIAVQKGQYYRGYELAEPTYIEKLAAIANVAADTSNPSSVADVRARKLSIVYGRDMSMEAGLDHYRGWSGVEFDDQSAFEEDEAIQQPLPEPTIQPEAPQSQMTVNEAIQIFVEKGIMTSPEYWINAYQVVNNLEALLIKTANKLKG